MLQFKIVKSTNSIEPSAEYFMSLEQTAASVPNSISITNDQAWSLGEYLDAVDGGSMPMNKSVYRQCTEALSNFIANATDSVFVSSFIDKCWAAKTLHELIQHCPTCTELAQQSA